MNKIKSGIGVSSFLDSIGKDLEIDYKIPPKIISIIEENYALFENMGREQEGCLDKLAFISAILRSHNLEHLDIVVRFNPTILKNNVEIFNFKICAETYKGIFMPLRENAISKFETLKNKYMKNKAEMIHEPRLRISSINSQLECIVDLFEQVKTKLNDDGDAAIALTSYFLYEAEAMSKHQIENLLMFYDLFDMNNKNDKWFSCIDLEAKYEKITFSINR